MQHPTNSIILHTKTYPNSIQLWNAVENPFGLPTMSLTQLALGFAAKPTFLLVMPVVSVKEAVLSSPIPISITAGRKKQLQKLKGKSGIGSGMSSQEWGKTGWRFWHWCQHTWLKVFIRLALSTENSGSFVQAKILVDTSSC